MIIFQSDKHIFEVLKLLGTMGTHMDRELRRDRPESVLITEKLLEDKALEEGQENQYSP